MTDKHPLGDLDEFINKVENLLSHDFFSKNPNNNTRKIDIELDSLKNYRATLTQDAGNITYKDITVKAKIDKELSNVEAHIYNANHSNTNSQELLYNIHSTCKDFYSNLSNGIISVKDAPLSQETLERLSARINELFEGENGLAIASLLKEKIDKEVESQLTAIKEESEKSVEKIDDAVNNSKALAKAVAVASAGEGAVHNGAKKQYVCKAWTFRVIGFLFFIALITYNWIYAPDFNSVSINTLTLRLLTTSVFVVPAIYCFNEASQADKLSIMFGDKAVKFLSLPNFIKRLSDEKQKELIEKLGENAFLFGENEKMIIEAVIKNSKGDYIDKVLGIIPALRKSLFNNEKKNDNE